MKKFVVKNLIVLFFLLQCLFAFSQEKQITGKVTDKSGQTLPGVTVIIKGTTQGTVTDIDGNYSIPNVPGEGIFVFSFVGMVSQEIEVGDQSSISVQMVADAIGIEEVVAIGYGTRKKSTLTGSVASISGDEMVKIRSANITSGLAGQLPGLIINQREGRPGEENLEIYIRGKATLGNSNSPLLVLGGITKG